MIKMIWVVTLLILKFLSEGEGGCPIRCNCTENAVNCVSKKLEQVPYFEDLENNPFIIDLSGNSIAVIDVDDFSFDKSDQVTEVYLNNSGVISIETEAFDELINLQGLYLSNNFLSTLPEDFIVYNENMVLLDLSNNYFDVMPKIKSDKLEVLTLANSRLSRIENDALDGLPNLRILLLQENNLKSINPILFSKMDNLFFVRIAYNPWFCNCKTVELFDYLTERKFVDLTETVQCQREDRIFIDVYTEKGPVANFKRQCGNSPSKNEQWETNLSFKNLEQTQDSEIEDTEIDGEFEVTKTDINEVYYMNFFSTLLFCFVIASSLVIGAICGSCVTYKYMKRNMKQTESTKKLLFNFS